MEISLTGAAAVGTVEARKQLEISAGGQSGNGGLKRRVPFCYYSRVRERQSVIQSLSFNQE